MDIAGVICGDLEVDVLQVDGLGLLEVMRTLDTTVEQDAIDVRMSLQDGIGELGSLVCLGDIELVGLGHVLAMVLDELVEILLSSSHDDDLDAVFYELGGERMTNPGCGPEDEGLFVVELTRHCDVLSGVGGEME